MIRNSSIVTRCFGSSIQPMQYQKLAAGETIIEFHNNWLGEETVIINGQVVSKKSSIMGVHHPFTLLENGQEVKYVLTSKVDAALQVFLDLRRNQVIIHENIPVSFGTAPKLPKNTFKQQGIFFLKKFQLEKAITYLLQALEITPGDPEIHFHLACAYSVLEQTQAGFESLKKAVAFKLQNTEIILNHDMLAFLRLNPAFEGFFQSNFTNYDLGLMDSTKD